MNDDNKTPIEDKFIEDFSNLMKMKHADVSGKKNSINSFPDAFSIKFGSFMKAYRIRNGITRKALSQQLRVSEAKIVGLENGFFDPNECLRTINLFLELAPHEEFQAFLKNADTPVEMSMISVPIPPSEEEMASVMTSPPPKVPKNGKELREWWFALLRGDDKYSCYATMLLLPSDREAIRYLTDYWKELDLISGENCLVLILNKNKVKLPDVEGKHNDEMAWNLALKKQAKTGHSLRMAKLFGVKLEEFPCLLLFRDIRSSEHYLISFKGMSTLEIANVARSLFSTIQEASFQGNDPLQVIEQHQNQKQIEAKKAAIVSLLRSRTGAALDFAMEALIKATLKSN